MSTFAQQVMACEVIDWAGYDEDARELGVYVYSELHGRQYLVTLSESDAVVDGWAADDGEYTGLPSALDAFERKTVADYVWRSDAARKALEDRRDRADLEAYVCRVAE